MRKVIAVCITAFVMGAVGGTSARAAEQTGWTCEYVEDAECQYDCDTGAPGTPSTTNWCSLDDLEWTWSDD